MKDRTQLIDEFFASYEQHFNDSLQGNAENIHEVMARSFADCFISSRLYMRRNWRNMRLRKHS